MDQGMKFVGNMQKFMDLNEVQRTLANQSGVENAGDVITFFYVWSVVSTTGGGYVERFMMSLIKAWGALAFVIPLVLVAAGQNVSARDSMIGNMDKMAYTVIAAMIVDEFGMNFINKFYTAVTNGNRVHEPLQQICSAIMKASMCATGYFMFQNAFRGNVMAPFLGACLAAMGEGLILRGVGAFNISYTGSGSSNGKLAVLGGMAMWFMMTQMQFSNNQARTYLGALNVGQIYFTYDPLVNAVANALDDAKKKLKAL